ncbi:MAG: hypothetical protein R3336_10060, partial [Phycisphaeraceae bacterium]|nr:hypothetical protein [Phycisphaeraceae bacterium]
MLSSVMAMVLCLATAGPAADAPVRDVFLVLGGGASATNNQVSLEKNVAFFRRVLDRLGLADATRHTLFADGEDPARDLQYRDRAIHEQLRGRLAAILGPTRHLDLRY